MWFILILLFLPRISWAQDLIVGENVFYPMRFSQNVSINVESPESGNSSSITVNKRTLVQVLEIRRNSQGVAQKYKVRLLNIEDNGSNTPIGEFYIWAGTLTSYLLNQARTRDEAAQALAVRLMELGINQAPHGPPLPTDGCDQTPASEDQQTIQHVSPRLIQLLIGFEGMRSRVYDCSAGCATIGVGHKISNSSMNSPQGQADIVSFWRDLGRPGANNLSNEEAQKLLSQDLRGFEQAVLNAIPEGMQLNQQQFDALVSWAYNLGSGHLSRESQTGIARALRANNLQQIPLEMLRWHRASGRPQAGLIKRRLAEAWLFQGQTPESVSQLVYKLENIFNDHDKKTKFMGLWNEELTHLQNPQSLERLKKFIEDN